MHNRDIPTPNFDDVLIDLHAADPALWETFQNELRDPGKHQNDFLKITYPDNPSEVLRLTAKNLWGIMSRDPQTEPFPTNEQIAEEIVLAGNLETFYTAGGALVKDLRKRLAELLPPGHEERLQEAIAHESETIVPRINGWNTIIQEEEEEEEATGEGPMPIHTNKPSSFIDRLRSWLRRKLNGS